MVNNDNKSLIIGLCWLTIMANQWLTIVLTTVDNGSYTGSVLILVDNDPGCKWMP